MDSEDELPPGIPSATGLPIYWLRASSSASVRGGGAGPPPVLWASAFFLVVEGCVSLNRLNYLTEHDIDEKTFMCVKTALGLCYG